MNNPLKYIKQLGKILLLSLLYYILSSIHSLTMKFLTLLSAFSAVALAQYYNTTSPEEGVTTITKNTVVTEFTTYCPYPTTIVTNNKTITVSEATTLTITDCPCTIETTITTSGSIPPEEESSGAGAVTTETVSTNVVVTEFTTYCPAATTIVTNGETYTATGETTLTITNCPCTVPTSTVITHTNEEGNTEGGAGNTEGGEGAGSTEAGTPAVSTQEATSAAGASSATVVTQEANAAGSLKVVGGSVVGLVAAFAYLF